MIEVSECPSVAAWTDDDQLERERRKRKTSVPTGSSDRSRGKPIIPARVERDRPNVRRITTLPFCVHDTDRHKGPAPVLRAAGESSVLSGDARSRTLPTGHGSRSERLPFSMHEKTNVAVLNVNSPTDPPT